MCARTAAKNLIEVDLDK